MCQNLWYHTNFLKKKLNSCANKLNQLVKGLSRFDLHPIKGEVDLPDEGRNGHHDGVGRVQDHLRAHFHYFVEAVAGELGNHRVDLRGNPEERGFTCEYC